VLGRGFSEDEDRAGPAHPVVIGYRLWRDRYGLDLNVLNRSVVVDGVPRAVVGVMPEGFRFPEVEVIWMPLGVVLERDPRAFEMRDARAWRIVARLEPNLAFAQARSELETFADRWADDHPLTNRDWTLSAVPVTEESLVATGRFFGALQAGALLLVVVMCGNLGNLLLARGEQRRRELAIRASLGASRGRLVFLLMSEAVLLSLTAAALALLLANWGIRLVPLAIPESIPFYIRFRIDEVVVAFTAVVALMSAIAAGLASASPAPRGDVARVLAGGAATLAAATGAGRLRSIFLFAQTALAAALLSSTLVVASGLLQFQRMDLEFEPANALLVELPLPAPMFATPGETRTFASRALERVALLPGVLAAGLSAPIPVALPPGTRNAIDVESSPDRGRSLEGPATYQSVTSGFFPAAGVRVLRGRVFTPADGSRSEPVAVVNAEAARRLFGEADAVGKRIRFGRAADLRPWWTIVGIVSNTVVQPLDPEVEPQIYVPYDQDPAGC
jgi:putative ABC transport system permease protein